jgi:4-amino-4-deoxy-L-arabinose transferase-like glycosyltransferase
MGSNSKQAQGLVLFIAAFVLLARGIASGGSVIYFLAALAALVLSIFVFRSAQDREDQEAKTVSGAAK